MTLEREEIKYLRTNSQAFFDSLIGLITRSDLHATLEEADERLVLHEGEDSPQQQTLSVTQLSVDFLCQE